MYPQNVIDHIDVYFLGANLDCNNSDVSTETTPIMTTPIMTTPIMTTSSPESPTIPSILLEYYANLDCRQYQIKNKLGEGGCQTMYTSIYLCTDNNVTSCVFNMSLV